MLLEGSIKLLLKLISILNLLLHTGTIEVVTIPTRLFGLVHRHVGLLHHIFRCMLIIRKENDADTGGNDQLTGGDLIGSGKLFKKLFGHLPGIHIGYFKLSTKIWNERYKLISPHS